MKQVIISVIALLLALPLPAKAQPLQAGQQPGIIAMGYLGFRDAAANRENFLRLSEAGVDMITLEMDQSSIQLQLDLAQETGLKILAVVAPYTDRNGIEEVDFDVVDDIVGRFKDHPALYGWHIYDEPGLKKIPFLKSVKDHIEALDPEHPVYINLNPLGSIRALGTDYYRDYIETFARECNPKLLSYDCYPTLASGVVNWWYMCNEALLSVSREYGIPWWGFAATCWIDREGPNNMHVKPTLENVRLQINTHLAYGAQVMQYFTIRDFGGSSLAPFMHNTEWTEAYDVLKAANLEMKCREGVFAGGRVVKTRFTHLTPFACLPLIQDDLPDAVSSLDSDRTALVSFIENGDARYLAVVNSSWEEKMTVKAEFRSPVSIIDRTGGVSAAPEGPCTFVVDEGDMLVVKY